MYVKARDTQTAFNKYEQPFSPLLTQSEKNRYNTKTKVLFRGTKVLKY